MAGPTKTHSRSPRHHQDQVVRPWQLSRTWPGWVWTTPWKMSLPAGKSDTGQLRLSGWNRHHPHRWRKFYPSRSLRALGRPWNQQAVYPWPEIQRMMMFSTATWNEWCFWENLLVGDRELLTGDFVVSLSLVSSEGKWDIDLLCTGRGEDIFAGPAVVSGVTAGVPSPKRFCIRAIMDNKLDWLICLGKDGKIS